MLACMHGIAKDGRAQAIAVINESGLYSLILRSRKSEPSGLPSPQVPGHRHGHNRRAHGIREGGPNFEHAGKLGVDFEGS